MAQRVAATARGRERRERIVQAAATLIAARGFHAVGVSDIGEAAGVTGAALYRHFDNKTAVLVAVFDRAIDHLLARASGIAAQLCPDVDALRSLIAAHIDFALRDRAVLAVYSQEQHSLTTDDRRRLRRKQRSYVELWRSVLLRAVPGVTSRAALARVEAVFGLLNSVPDVSPTLRDEELGRELRAMALAALLAPTAPS